MSEQVMTAGMIDSPLLAAPVNVETLIAQLQAAAAPKPAKLLLTQHEAWEYLGIGRATFYALKGAGKLPKPVAIEGGVRYRVADLERYVEGLRHDGRRRQTNPIVGPGMKQVGRPRRVVVEESAAAVAVG